MQYQFTKYSTIASLVTSLFALPNFAVAADKIIKIDGSSTVYPITEAVAEEFQKSTMRVKKLVCSLLSCQSLMTR